MSKTMCAKALCATLCAIIASAALTAGTHASFINIESNSEDSAEGLGSFTGIIEYVADSAIGTQGLLTINLTNTTPASIGGFITGFVFNIASSDPNATATLTSATHPFVGVTNHQAPPFGSSFTAGAALGGNWAGGGQPQLGIGIGSTGTFSFDVFASDASLLNPMSFLSGPYDHNFVVRLGGMIDGGSDKVPAVPSNPVPAPGALAMLIAAGLVMPRRRSR
jgi:hypothetical protein